MVYLKITIDEENLDHKLRKLLAERQSERLLTVERVETNFFKVMAPTKRGTEPRRKPRPEKFVEAVKFIVRNAALQNNKVKDTFENGLPARYCFWLDDEAWCKIMDKLLAEYRELIAEVLKHKYQADSVNLIASYIGSIIDQGLFQKNRVQKTDLLASFTAYYGKPMASVQTKLSTSHIGWTAFNKLVNKTYEIAAQEGK